MKIRIAVAAIILCTTVIVLAITEQWSVPAGAIVYQTVADGTGGCAMYYVTTNGIGHVVWLDKKGQEKYRKTTMPAGLSPVISCTKKMLVFTVYSTSTLHYALAVDSKGVETEIKKDHSYMYPPILPGLGANQSGTDKKGFFIQSIKTNNMGATLYRYTYK